MHMTFRVDASLQIGTGHVMRCLTLASALREAGAQCSFICRPHEGHLLELIAQKGHVALALPKLQEDVEPNDNSPIHAHWLGTDWATDAHDTSRALHSLMGNTHLDWLVVDNYALDSYWEKAMRPLTQKIMVIDDLADRAHDCDLLLDQNLGRSVEDYRSLVPNHAKKLIGPRYALLRPEFKAMRKESLARRQDPQLNHLLITLGGVDKDNLTGEVLQTLRMCHLPINLRITVVMGPHAPWLQNVQAIAAAMPRPTQVKVSVRDMANLMTDSDLVIGAAGGTVWECCSLGLPSFVLTAAENQRGTAHALKKSGAALLIESTRDIAAYIENPLLSDTPAQQLKQLSTAAAAITDGEGLALVSQELRRIYA